MPQTKRATTEDDTSPQNFWANRKIKTTAKLGEQEMKETRLCRVLQALIMPRSNGVRVLWGKVQEMTGFRHRDRW